MTLISASLRKRYSHLLSQASVCLHRHRQPDMALELKHLAAAVNSDDARDSYGNGGVVGAFESELQSLFAAPACVFLPTGTLAQCAAMKCYSEVTGKAEIGLHPTSHLLLHEHKAIEHLWGIRVQQFGDPQKVISTEDLHSLTPDTLAAIIIESPMREIGGAIPSWDTLKTVRDWCDRHRVYMHLDGARVWQTPSYYNRELAEIAGLFDSVYISFYKDLGGIAGAALLGSQTLINETKIWARRAGGNPITQYPEVLAARAGLRHHLPRMPDYVSYTAALSKTLSESGYTLVPASPQGAMFHVVIPLCAETLTARICDYAEQTGIMVLPLPREGNQTSCVCELSVGDQATRQAPSFWLEHINRAIAECGQ